MVIRPLGRGLIGILIVSSLAGFGISFPAMAGSRALSEDQSYDDWELRCRENTETGLASCFIYQESDSSQGRLTALAFGYRGNQGPLIASAEVPTPLAERQPVNITIDGKDHTRLELDVCTSQQCILMLSGAEDLVEAAKAGLKAQLAYTPADREAPVVAVYSLMGFTAAYDALQARTQELAASREDAGDQPATDTSRAEADTTGAEADPPPPAEADQPTGATGDSAPPAESADTAPESEPAAAPAPPRQAPRPKPAPAAAPTTRRPAPRSGALPAAPPAAEPPAAAREPLPANTVPTPGARPRSGPLPQSGPLTGNHDG